MNKYIRVVLLSLLMFDLLISAKSFSSQRNKSQKESNILIGNLLEEQKIKTVIANGYGKTLESASQNAAENALTNVVGSFLDAETILKEKTEIINGILNESTIIKENINDYSQGSIKYFKILKVEEKDSIYIVTARVDVRIDDFRAYIKKLAFQTKEISTTNLFAEMGTKKDNLDNKFELLKKIVTPIYEGEVIDISIGELTTLDSYINSQYCLLHSPKRYCNPSSSYFYDYLNPENTVIFHFSLLLRKDFKTNALNILNNISDLKTTSISSASGKDVFNNIARVDPYNFYYSQDVGVIFRDHGKQTKSEYFILKEIGPRSNPFSSSSQISKKYVQNYNKNARKLKISLLDANGETIYTFDEICGYETSFEGSLKNVIQISKVFRDGYIGDIQKCPSQLYYTYRNGDNTKFDITSQKDFVFAFQVDNLDELKEFKEIKIEYVQR